MQMNTTGYRVWLDQVVSILVDCFHRVLAASDEFIGTMLGHED